MKFQLSFSLDDAFAADDPAAAISIILEEVGQSVMAEPALPRESRRIKDVSGNTIGSYRVEEGE